MGISSSLLSKVFTPEFCNANEKVFISCIQGVATIFGFDKELKSIRKKGFISKFPYEISTDLDPLVIVRWKASDTKENFLEKSLAMRQEELSSWKELFALAKVKNGFWEEVLKVLLAQDFYLEKESWISIEAINSIYRVLVDPHTFLTPRAFLEAKKLAEAKSYSGVGMKAQWAFLNNRRESFIAKLYDQGPAQKSGLRVGDWLVEIAGRKTTHLMPDEIALLLRGDKNTQVEVKVIRGAELLKFTLTRDNVEQEQVSSCTLSPTVGYLRIHDFELTQEMGKTGLCKKVEEKLHELEKANAESLILDLRNNWNGHLINAAVCVTNFFLKQRRVVALSKDSDPNLLPSQHTTIDPQKWLKPMVVLINGQTTNMAEIVAGSLQDYYRAFLVGERSNGKASSQRDRVLHHKVSFFETTDVFYLPSGRTPEGHPISPDFEVFEEGKKEGASFYRNENEYVLVPKVPEKENPRKELVAELKRALDAKNVFKAYSSQTAADKIQDYQIYYAMELLALMKGDAFGYVPSEKHDLPGELLPFDRKNLSEFSIKLENLLIMAFQKIQ